MKVLDAGGGLTQEIDQKTIILTVLRFRAHAWASLQAFQPVLVVSIDLALPQSAAEPMISPQFCFQDLQDSGAQCCWTLPQKR